MKITTKSHPKLIKLMKSAYPEYNGRKFYMNIRCEPFLTISYWDEGSRTYYKFLRWDGKMLEQPDSAPWTQHQSENRTTQLVPGLACITHSINQGIDCGISIYFHPDDIPKQLEAK
jgi:hypothetical protein